MAETCTRCLIRSSDAYECSPWSESLFNYIYLCLQRGERYYWLWEVATQIFTPRSRRPAADAQAEPKDQTQIGRPSSGLPAESWSLRPGSRGSSGALVCAPGGWVANHGVLFSSADSVLGAFCMYLMWPGREMLLASFPCDRENGGTERQVAPPGSHSQEEAGPGFRLRAAT